MSFDFDEYCLVLNERAGLHSVPDLPLRYAEAIIYAHGSKGERTGMVWVAYIRFDTSDPQQPGPDPILTVKAFERMGLAIHVLHESEPGSSWIWRVPPTIELLSDFESSVKTYQLRCRLMRIMNSKEIDR